MSARPLGRRFFTRPTLDLARALLGTWLCRAVDGEVRRGRIVEVEAYTDDDASHCRARRRTPRNAVMFGHAGHAYVYFTYGMHWMLCLVTGHDGGAQAVLIRAGEVVAGQDVAATRRPGVREREWCRGPARLATTLALDGSATGRDFCVPHRPAAGEPIDLVVRPPASPPDTGRIRTGPRVGVSGPGGDGAAYPWRFWLDGEASVSPYRPGVIRQRRRS